MKEKEMPKKYAKTIFTILILTIVIASFPVVSAEYGTNTQFGYGFSTNTPLPTSIVTPMPTSNPTIPELSSIIIVLSLTSITLILIGFKIIKKQRGILYEQPKST